MQAKAPVGQVASRLVLKAVEHAALLALAFCNSHQLAAQDLRQYEKLERWDFDEQGEEGAAASSKDVSRLKRSATGQVDIPCTNCQYCVQSRLSTSVYICQ